MIDGARARRGEASRPRIFVVIWEVVARIPRSRVATYGQVARMAGLPGGARTVGWAMRALPDELRIGGRPVPWQRVINAEGRISARRGARGDDGSLRQAAALRREGIAVSRGGAIDLERHHWSGRKERGRSSVGAPSARAANRRGRQPAFPRRSHP
jgi:methylated-DNA-protein-cysteine methyltransferase-like protein